MADAAEASATDRLLSDQAEPAFDLVQPGRTGGRVVDVEAGPLRQPEAHLGMLVGGIVVDDQMDIEICGHCLVDALEKAGELLMPVPRPAPGEDRSGGDIRRPSWLRYWFLARSPHWRVWVTSAASWGPVAEGSFTLTSSMLSSAAPERRPAGFALAILPVTVVRLVWRRTKCRVACTRMSMSAGSRGGKI
jgi:hypothetical protein